MSYVDFHRPAPFGATTARQTTAAVREIATGLRHHVARRLDTLDALGPDELEDIGLSGAARPARQRSHMVARFVAAIRTRRAHRSTIATLGRLSDAQLDDIGLRRSEVETLRFGRALG